MDSIDKTCTPLKQQYDQCFNKWYLDKFLTGQHKEKDGDEPCAQLFKQYKACVSVSFLISNLCSLYLQTFLWIKLFIQ